MILNVKSVPGNLLQGEICVAGSRVYVQEGIYDEFVAKAAKSAKSWVVGDPFDPNARQGPQVLTSLALQKYILSLRNHYRFCSLCVSGRQDAV